MYEECKPIKYKKEKTKKKQKKKTNPQINYNSHQNSMGWDIWTYFSEFW